MSLLRPCRSYLFRRLPLFSFFSYSGRSRDDNVIRAECEAEVEGDWENREGIKIRKKLSPIKLGDATCTVHYSSFLAPHPSIQTPQVLMPTILDRIEMRRNKLQASQTSEDKCPMWVWRLYGLESRGPMTRKQYLGWGS